MKSRNNTAASLTKSLQQIPCSARCNSIRCHLPVSNLNWPRVSWRQTSRRLLQKWMRYGPQALPSRSKILEPAIRPSATFAECHCSSWRLIDVSSGRRGRN